MKSSALNILVVSVGCLAALATMSTFAHSQVGGVKNQVWLQSSSPGVSQSGHSAISGTSRAGQFVGGGAGLTSLSAAQLVGVVPTSSIPVPLLLSGSVLFDGVVSTMNSANVAGSSGIKGQSTATSATTYGVLGMNSSTVGSGVYGWATSGTGGSRGVYARTDSTSGYGLYATSTALTGTNYAVYATADGIGSYAIYANHGGTSGAPISLLSETAYGNAHAILGRNTSLTGTAYAVAGESSSTSARAVVGRASATTGTTYAIYGFNQSSSGRGVYGTSSANSGTTYGVYGDVDSPAGYGVYGTGPQLGVYGLASADSGIGVRGTNNINTGSAVGVEGSVTSLSGTGVYGLATGSTGNLNNAGVYGNNTGSGIGVLARSANGTALWAVGTVGIEIVAEASGILAFGEVIGVKGVAQRQAAGSFAIGTDGIAYHPTGIGAMGEMVSIVPVTPSTGYGVYGLSNRNTDRALIGDTDATSGTPYGVFGDSDGAGWALYASGNSGGSGTKSFRIDHPLDPANKYLLHYSTESPEPMNFYSGNVVTGADGYAWVTLPNYFSEINRELRYQLTVIDNSDDFVLVKVCEEEKNGRFRIRTNQPRIKVSWRVEALRNDAYVRHFGAPTEVDKPDLECGLYEHPEIYGFGKELSLAHDQPKFKNALRARHQQSGASAERRGYSSQRKGN